VITAVSRDGTLEGFDLDLIAEMSQKAPEAQIIASGGAGELAHLRSLARAGLGRLAGAIAGTALYENKFSVRDGQAALEAPC
jgi:phosphoribosyl isomerase A